MKNYRKKGVTKMKRNSQKQIEKEFMQISKYIRKQYSNLTMERVIDYCIRNNFDRTALKTYEILKEIVKERQRELDIND